MKYDFSKVLTVLLKQKAVEFLAGVVVLDIFFSITGESYWGSGPRDLVDTLTGSFYIAILFEFLTAYVIVSSITYFFSSFFLNRTVVAGVASLTFVTYAIILTSMLYHRSDIYLISAISVMGVIEFGFGLLFGPAIGRKIKNVDEH